MSIREELANTTLAFTSAEEKIVQVLLADYPMSGLVTATRLARRAGVSDPSVTRLMTKLGYVGFAEEVAAQEKELGFTFDYIVVCVVTGSTQGGMIVGFAAQNRAESVIGIDASGTLDQTRAQVRKIVDSTAELVDLGRPIRESEIVINPDYAYPAYGVPSEETNDAIRLAARTEAMITDPVYEGKSMQGMIDLTRKGFFPEGSKVLYAHLGGAPALNGYSYYYKDG